jgi:hypothetical protein
MIKWISHNPVAALTTLYTVLAAVYGVISVTDILPDKVVGIIAFIIAILAAILGAVTHQKVTPLVDPKNNAGQSLVALQPGGRVR